ncbi:helix-turn-helix transcriptional regulator [Catenulispora sp. NF23]|uniref:Helix-turn-helix transcriptional regulator n=1 Tax=Catenulispora pinistramenti TaxID=2705254 RepID=A0ABS5KUB2_9ACTN|nr:PadR family transcriptional regulator [Catenulispora pinistramenti]MBS2533264.1 helix-turn-helix transcriptional regulator [Catenulispora pinistramenti]MBS2549652.1 helix-turn-helix transcriptional regulator [Catenulispora pinistramenti]
MIIRGKTEPVFLILTALADEPRHGYGIIQEVRRVTDGRVDLRVGTLYGALDRLAAEGLVEKHGDAVESGRLRRYFRLTETGAQALAAEASRMAADAAVAMERLKKFTAPARSAGLDIAGGLA